MVMKMEEGLDTGAGRDGRARGDSARHDRRRTARRAGAARRRPDGARARRAGARRAARSRRSRATASPMPPRSTRPKRGSTGRKPCARGARPYPRPVAVSRRLVRDGRRAASRRASRCCATTRARARARPATVLDDRLTIACGDGAMRILELQRAGKQPMTAEEFLRGTPVAAGHGARAEPCPATSSPSNMTARPLSAGRSRTTAPSVQGALDDAVKAFCGEQRRDPRRRPHRRRRARARPGRALSISRSDWDADTRARRAERASAPASDRGALGRDRAGRFRRALLGDASGTISIASSTAAPISRSIATAPGACRGRSMRRRCTRPRSGSLGKHDFTTFRAAECQAKSPVKTLDRLDVVARRRRRSHIHASARSFLHSQVRSMVGSLVQVGEGKWSADDLAAALAARDRALRPSGAAGRAVSGGSGRIRASSHDPPAPRA